MHAGALVANISHRLRPAAAATASGLTLVPRPVRLTHLASRPHLDCCYLQDSILRHVEARRLDVEGNKGPLQPHGACGTCQHRCRERLQERRWNAGVPACMQTTLLSCSLCWHGARFAASKVAASAVRGCLHMSTPSCCSAACRCQLPSGIGLWQPTCATSTTDSNLNVYYQRRQAKK